MPTRNVSETNLNNNQSRNNTITIRQNSQASSRKQTKDNGYHRIAYQQQIKKNQISLKRKRSVSSISSTSSMQQSFMKMEEKMKKFKLNNPEIIDQKYMISGYLELSKDYKNLVFTIRKYGQDLDALLKFGQNDMKEDNICKVDQFFEKHSDLLSTKVDDYFKIKESFYRFLRMRIQEPYYYRVKKKLHLIEKQNQTFQTFRIYLDAFKFINKDGFEYFKDDIQLIRSFKKPPTLENIGTLFNEKIEQLRDQILKTQELTDGKLLSQIFDHKIEQIQRWKEQIIKLAYFQYSFNIHYLLNTNSKTRKYIKSKKLYEQLFQILEETDQFLIENYTINQIYSEQIAQFKCDLSEIKQQILEWNIKLRENEFYKQVLSLVKQNIYLKSINQRLETILSIRSSEEYDQRMDAKATDMIIKAKMQLQNIVPTIQQIKSCQQIKDDEYIQKQFNKFVLMKDYFQNLKNEFEI
ncbi:unnamed protein product (macronuclear) [Paramecium tetraurelia]|uniref:Uncharacterized protein n=1 Tax=Paramecium tetraurelia TaxID=5888 RepID=A0D1V4_PARTE|nr:uncharacterized protein GSPATT00012546001 [Paramecium tetraurelia]CAK77021.1 unnamed protein product [Paramecium tetraurelia]|eukprot:XP_001444418.1 hypothetical protein (macronuclear) [Paramecium tetraurelia strain d4-2]